MASAEAGNWLNSKPHTYSLVPMIKCLGSCNRKLTPNAAS